LGQITSPRPRGAAPPRRPYRRGSARVPVGAARRDAGYSARRTASRVRGTEAARRNLSRRSARVRGRLETGGLVAPGTDPVVPGAAVRYHGRRGAGAGGDARAAPPRPVHDAAEGLRRRAEGRGLDHLAVAAEARGSLELRRPAHPYPSSRAAPVATRP